MRPGRGERSSGRGYEYILEALQKIVKKFPNVLYIIAGVTHPNTIKREGEQYRYSLMEKVKELDLVKNVKFINKYLSLDELLTLLQATDIYVFSGQNPNQITSGTLIYAMGCGTAIVSTQTLHAKQVINKDRGILVKFDNARSFEKAITKILSNPDLKNQMGKNAYEYTRHMTWRSVGEAYRNLFDEYI